MEKLASAIVAFIIGTVSLGLLAACFYFFFTYPQDTREYMAHYGEELLPALVTFINDPYKGDSFVNDDLYIRNGIFGLTALVMGLLIYRQL